MQLTDRADDKVEPLSGGMKRRLTIARALINEPDVVLLDEPTTGLDPQARHVLWERLYRLKQRGVTLVLTTHYMDEAEQLCDRLVVMDKGRIAAEGSPARADPQLVHPRGLRAAVPAGRGQPAPSGSCRRQPVVDRGAAERIESLPDRLLLYADDGDAALAAVLARRGAAAVDAWSGAARWRTSSCGSPAARWWTDGARRHALAAPGARAVLRVRGSPSTGTTGVAAWSAACWSRSCSSPRWG